MLLVGCALRPAPDSITDTAGSASPETSGDALESEGGEAPPCDTLGTTPEDAAAACGLAQVQFAAGEFALDARAQCQLTAAAPCLAELESMLLEAHASSDETGTVEHAILLTDRRGQGVKDFLAQQGLSVYAMQVISKGPLEAEVPANPADQRVRIIVERP